MKIKLSIRQKIIITFLILFFIVILVSLLSFFNYSNLNQTIHILEKKEALLNNILEARRYEKNFFISYDIKNLIIAKSFIEKSEDQLENIILTEKDNDNILSQELLFLKQYKDAISNFINKNKNNKNIKTNSKEIHDIREKGRKATVFLEKAISKRRKTIQHIINQSRNFLFITIITFISLAIITFLFLLKNVTKPLKNIEEAIQKIVSGDYDKLPNIQTGDEFENLVKNINYLLTEMRLRNKQLLQKEKMAALGTLTSGVAHEINNPLNNISTSLQILLEEIDAGDKKYQQELLQESLNQVDRAKEIVRNLLEFSRETSFSLKNINFKQLVQNTLKLIQGEVPTHIQLEIDIPSDLEVKIDPRRIQQVILNLVLNAIQALDKKEGTITVAGFKKKNNFIFEVKDSGPGIPKENLSKIFDPFFTTKDVGKGSGLGLAVCQGIISQHGGKIEVQSKEGQGTTFSVIIPQDNIVES
ncbi:sensor histidine kinase [Desulfonauticus submarinus]|nr:sensor histidine kinase [Desulfonauticus submarinus]